MKKKKKKDVLRNTPRCEYCGEAYSADVMAVHLGMCAQRPVVNTKIVAPKTKKNVAQQVVEKLAVKQSVDQVDDKQISIHAVCEQAEKANEVAFFEQNKLHSKGELRAYYKQITGKLPAPNFSTSKLKKIILELKNGK